MMPPDSAAARQSVKQALALPLPLQALLLWQTGALLAVLGMVSAWYVWPGLLATALVFWLDRRAWRPVVALTLALCWGLGLFWGQIHAERLLRLASSPLPAWALTGKPVPVVGRVVSVRGLVDDRVRFVLDEVRPAFDNADEKASALSDQRDQPALPGKLAVTRDGAGLDGIEAPALVPGQSLRASLKIRPLRPVGVWEIARDLYWPRQGVVAVAYLSRGAPPPVITGEGWAMARWREALRAKLVRVLDARHPLPRTVERHYAEPAPSAPAGWGVLTALLFGDRRHMGQTDMERFTHAGLAHSLALSGQHLAIAALGALLLALGAGRLHGGLYLHVPRFKLVAALSVPLALAYVWLGDAPPSLVRAAAMLGLWTLCSLANRPCGRIDLLLMALFFIMAADPTMMHDTGLQLSFAAVAGLALALPLFTGAGRNGSTRSRTLPHRLATTLWGVFACTLAVHMASLPLIMDVFGRLGPWSILNVIWLPVLAVWVLPLAFAGLVLLVPGVVAPDLAEGLLQALEALAGFSLELAAFPCRLLTDGLARLDAAGWLDSVWGLRPHWTSLMGGACLLLALGLLARRPAAPVFASPLFPFVTVRRLLLAGVCLLLIGPALRMVDGLRGQATLRLLDVGQGQAVLLAWPGGHRLLVDGGGNLSPRFDVGRDVLAPVLTDNAPLRINQLVLSHPHVDHLLGLLFVARKAGPEALAVPEGLHPGAASKQAEGLAALYRAAGMEPQRAARGDSLQLNGNLVLDVLHPPRGRTVSGNEGLIVRLVQLQHTPDGVQRRGLALLAGDAPSGVLRELVDSGLDLRSEILVAPHHGSDANFVPAFIEAVAPLEVWASLGWNNSYGFPGMRLRAFLAERHIPFRSTGVEGSLERRW